MKKIKELGALPEVKYVWIRRPVTILLGMIVFPICLLDGMFTGIKTFWALWIKECW